MKPRGLTLPPCVHQKHTFRVPRRVVARATFDPSTISGGTAALEKARPACHRVPIPVAVSVPHHVQDGSRDTLVERAILRRFSHAWGTAPSPSDQPA